MAVKATFQADFKSFYDAVEKAEVELRGLETGAVKVEKSLNRMTDSFSGRKLIQDANLAARAVEEIGGASKLTEQEQRKVNAQVTEALAKYKALGLEAPAHLQKLAKETAGVTKEAAAANTGIGSMAGSLGKVAGALGVAFSVGAAVNFGKQVFAAAGQVNDLSKKMGVSTEAVQRWKFAAEQSGATIENVDKAVLAMNKSLGSIDSSEIGKTTDALNRIGLSFDELRMMKPEDAFNAITKAIGEVENPMVRAKVATELFSKAGAELLPALADNFAKVAAGASVMSDDTIQRLADAEDAWDALYTKTTVVTGEIIAFLMKEFNKESPLEKFFKDAQLSVNQSFSLMGLDIQKAASDFRELLRLKDAAFGNRGATPTAPGAPAGQSGAGAPKLGLSPAEEAQIVKGLNATVEGLDRAHAAAKKHAEALAAVNKKIRELTTGSRALSDEQATSATRFLKLGLSASETALKIGASEVAVTKFQQEQADLNQILKNGIASTLGLSDAFKSLQQQYSTFMVATPRLTVGLGNMTLPGIKTDAPGLSDQQKRDDEANLLAMERRYQETFGKLKESGKQLGVDLVWSLADGVRSGDWSQFENQMRDSLSHFMGSAAAAGINMLVPGLGSLLEPLLGAISDKILGALGLGTKGRDLVKEFAASVGGFDALREQLNVLGAEGEKLWINLTQGVGKNNPQQAMAAIKAIEDALRTSLDARASGAGFQTIAELKQIAAEAVKLAKEMEASGLYSAGVVQSAWERANAALIASGDQAAIAAGKAKDAISTLKAELKSLQDSVAAEAPEEVMGVIETQQRARIKAIEEEMQARQAQIDEETEARKSAAEEAADNLQKVLSERDFIAKLRFDYELPEGLMAAVGGPFPGFASGTRGKYLDFGAGTLAMLHGKERVVTEAEGRAGLGTGEYGELEATLVMPNGEVLTKQIVKVRKRLRLRR